MYEPFFEFRKRPFSTVANADDYFPGQAIEAARTTLVRCVRRAEGPGLIIGPAGTGKTLLCHVMAKELADQFRVVLLASGRLSSRRALLQAILYALGQPYRGLDEGEARLAVADYITLSDECPHGVLLLVDEAHTLPLRLLDEVRMTTNIAHQGKPWVRVVLAGGSALEEHFASPRLDSFNQRIAARCYLESLGAAETQEYVWAQTNLAGGCGQSLFPETACKATYRATDGVPRLINQVCDHALLLACAAGHRQITPGHIEEAWADLQQLPTPWNGESAHDSTPGDIIEFGRLDDEPESLGDEAEEPDTVPALRISAGSDDSTEADQDIEGRVDQIEQMLDGIDSEENEFEPAGSIGPEVELRFDEPHNPFAEEFAEEEIVDDWPETIGRTHFPDSAPGQASPRQPAAPAGDPAPAANVAMGNADAAMRADGAAMDDDDVAIGNADAAIGDADVAMDDDDVAMGNGEAPVEGSEAEPATEESLRLPVDAPSEAELACTATHSEPTPPASTCRVAAAPRPKYSRLFATLRQA